MAFWSDWFETKKISWVNMWAKKKSLKVQSNMFNSKNMKFDWYMGKHSMCFLYSLTTTMFTTRLTPDMFVFHTLGSSPQHQLGVLWLISVANTAYLRLPSDHTAHGPVPQDGLSFRLQVVTGTSHWLAVNWGSRDPLLGFANLLEWLIELRDTHNIYWFIIKDTVKDMNALLNEQIHWVRSRRAQAQELHPHEVGVNYSPCMFITLEAFQTPSFGVFMEALLCRDSWLNHCPLVIKLNFQPLSLHWRWRRGRCGRVWTVRDETQSSLGWDLGAFLSNIKVWLKRACCE